MTVLQEEQEKPQIETGPTRHAKIMRGIVTPIFGLLAIACVVFGVLNSTVWKPDNEITAAAPVNGSEYVVTDPNVLQLVDSRVNISAKSRDKKSNVCIAIGSARDVAGWIAGSKYMRVSGLSDWTTLSTMKVSAQGPRTIPRTRWLSRTPTCGAPSSAMTVPLICRSKDRTAITPRMLWR